MDRLLVNIRLDLSRHCIETEIKRVYNKSVAQYFNSPTDRQQLETRIDVLKHALERFDFSFLRSRYPLLSGRNKQKITLAAGMDGNIFIVTPTEVIRV